MNSYAGIKQSVVVVKDVRNNNSSITKKCVIGFFVSNEQLPEKSINLFLRKNLPAYMVPNRIVPIEKIPTNFNGKLDINKLPEVEFISNSEWYVAPENELEERLCRLWAEILELPSEKIGIHDDFFTLGGNSIMALKMDLAISAAFSVEFFSGSFMHRTIKELAEHLESNKNRIRKRIPRLGKSIGPLYFGQETLIVIEHFENSACLYNLPYHYKLAQDIDIVIFLKALLCVIQFQDALRTIFINEDGRIFQQALDFDTAETMLEIDTVVVSDEEHLTDEMLRVSKRAFDLQKVLPIRIQLYYNQGGACTHFSLVIHHLVTDDWSRSLFENDLVSHYTSLKNGEKFVPPVNITYRDFAEWIRNELSDEKSKNLLVFWQNKLRESEPLNLPTDFQRPAQFDYQAGEEILFELDEKSSKLIKGLARRLKVSLYR